MSFSESNDTTGRGGIARKVEVVSSAIALVVACSIMVYAGGGRFSLVMLIFLAWVTLPYVAFFAVTTHLYRSRPNTALSWTAATISVLMLAFTSFVYIDGILIHTDAQSGLLFLFVPFYLLVGGFVMLLIGLAFGKKRPPVGHCAQCGYNLRGLTEPRCPECGTRFVMPKLDADR